MIILPDSHREEYGLVYSVYGNDFKNELIIYTHEQDKDVYDYKSAHWDKVPQWDVRGTDCHATKEECLLLMEYSRVKQGLHDLAVSRYYNHHFHIITEEVKTLRYKYVCINPTELRGYGTTDKDDRLYVYQLDGYNEPFSWLFMDSNTDGVVKPQIIKPSVFDNLGDDWKLEYTETVFLEHSIQRSYNVETNMTEEFIEVYYDTRLGEYAAYKEFVMEQAL